MTTKEDIKLAKLQLKAAKHAQDMAVVRQLVSSPVVQLVGTVAIAELLEAGGILSGKWAGALEGGVIAMVGLQALKDYGVLGAGALGLGIGAGTIAGSGPLELIKTLLPMTQLPISAYEAATGR